MDKQYRSSFKSLHRIVVKIGTKILVDENNQLNTAAFRRIVRGVKKIRSLDRQVILVTSGAIGTGMGVLGLKERPCSIPEKQATAAVGQNKLMHRYQTEFAKNTIHAAQVLMTAEDLNNKNRYLNIKNTISTLLRMGVVPIINENDSVAVDEIRVGDNDTLSALVTLLSGAELLILLTDCDGLMTSDPHTGSTAERIRTVSRIDEAIHRIAGRAGSRVATGGMKTKIMAARMVTSAGRAMIIADGRMDVLEKIIQGKDVGTLLLP